MYEKYTRAREIARTRDATGGRQFPRVPSRLLVISRAHVYNPSPKVLTIWLDANKFARLVSGVFGILKRGHLYIYLSLCGP